ncbi:MAG: glycine cleavage system protein GcvH [Anaerolineae bacterium]|nr:glycine cleavage system protein GcvH [Anaerolineae bacterium]
MGTWKVPDNLKYAKTDEWLLIEGDTGTVGITDYAQDALNDIVFLELPSVGDTFEVGTSFGVVESVKAASDLTMPVSGTVTAVNDAAVDEPEVLNTDPFEGGWLVKIKIDDASQADALLDAAAYAEFCESR